MVISSSTTAARAVQSATAKELQLPSMIAFTQKNSTQQCLLRTLNTTTLLRETIRQQQQQLQQHKSQAAAAVEGGTSNNAANGASAAASAGTSASADVITPMEADEGIAALVFCCGALPFLKTLFSAKPTSVLESAPLSQLLKLDDLWDELSVCLSRLREAADPHAVLVLQPAVEAFFLAHAASRSQREAVRFCFGHLP